MSNMNTDIATVMKMLGAAPGAGAGSIAPNLAARKGEEGAFDMELMMAQKFFSESGENNGYSAGDMDMGVMSGVLMLEALTALNSIKGLKGAGAGQSNFAVDAYQQRAAASVNSPVKKMSIPQVSGDLSAQFESGSKGVAAIGYDRIGGTSYGKYQIASKTGTMDRFIEFLKDKAPEIADKLLNAGPANTGSKNGRMPDLWKSIASKDPEGFEKLQHDFIQGTHYDPAAKMILEQTGVDINSLPKPIREVLWSTSVQHGPTGASRLIARAMDKLASNAESKGFPIELVKEIYGERQGQFTSSTGAVQKSVAGRLTREQNLVLSMLGESSILKTV
ncbi:hypothetical protein [Maridesulfovibrio hydrothermalis]|uniref:Type VI secretion system spike protein VgrG3-like C-terminal domain-containing protein n=1 Tax=Maridesulfovibrio hydrothermalis AM13 = DSM 14728 TaxID=1121451 RepID=L0RFI6_9BACT|nr:hypothetical protein [Maridesulfovibrio hydrothermalis]CCO24977.1 conserved protein of unknown function [Maridesulfovibrio hydrothermalis AM13 = DSM 14728]